METESSTLQDRSPTSNTERTCEDDEDDEDPMWFDILLLPDSEGNLQRVLFPYSKSGKELNLTISVQKNKCITI